MTCMKKILILTLMTCMLWGCSGKDDAADVMYDTYESYYRAIMANADFAESSQNYTVSTEIVKTATGKYSYYIIVDDPQVSMKNVVILAVEAGTSVDEETDMMPSSGIFDEAVHMIPGQVDREAGYVKGIIVSGSCADNNVDMYMLVQWENAESAQVTREFLSFRIE